MDFWKNHLHDILVFISGIVSGIAGSFITVKLQRANSAKGNSRVVDQSGATAGRDIVGGNSSTKN